MSKTKTQIKKRCGWAQKPVFHAYHDEEWGVPTRDERLLFEMLILEGAQAGLSWELILRRRAEYRRAFDNFAVGKVARYGERKKAALLRDAGIVRNRLKIAAAVSNARAFMRVQDEFGGFAPYIWGFSGGAPVVNRRKSSADMPASSPLSDAVSKDLKKRGFRFAGSVIVYSYLQAIGVIDDHEAACDWARPAKKIKKT